MEMTMMMNRASWLRVLDLARNLTSPELLGLYGAARKRGRVEPAVLLGAGAALGLAAGVLLSTRAGNDLRTYLLARFEEWTQQRFAGARVASPPAPGDSVRPNGHGAVGATA
jgi:hypothetical protein